MSIGSMSRLTSAVFLLIATSTLLTGWVSDRLIAAGVSPTRVRRAAVVGRLALGAGSSSSTPRGSAIAMPAGKTHESFPPGHRMKASLGDGSPSAGGPAPKRPAPKPVGGTPAKLRKTPPVEDPAGSARGGRSRRAPMSRQWDRVVRDGQVIFVPRPASQPSDPPSATGRARRSQRGR